MPGVRDNAERIVSTLKTLNENIKREYTPRLPEPMNSQMERILSLDPEKERELIIAIYDDLLDDFIVQGIEYPL